MILIFCFYFIIAGVMILGKQLVLYASPSFLAAIRLIPAGVIFLGIDKIRYKHLKLPFFRGRDAFLTLLYAMNILFVDVTRLKGLSYIPSSNAALMTMIAPFLAVILSWKFFGEHITRKKIGALCLGIAGVAPLILSHVNTSIGSLSESIIGYCLMVLSTLGIIMSGIFAKHLVQGKGYQLFTITGLVMIGGGLLGLLNSLITEVWNPIPLTEPAVALPIIAVLFLFHSLIAFPLYGYLVQKYPITLVSFTQCIMPFLTALMGWYYAGETISVMFFVSFAILAFSLYLFYHEELKEGLIK